MHAIRLIPNVVCNTAGLIQTHKIPGGGERFLVTEARTLLNQLQMVV